MSEAEVIHMHEDLEAIKQDIALIKHILVEEGELTDNAKQRLEKARKIPLSQYTKL